MPHGMSERLTRVSTRVSGGAALGWAVGCHVDELHDDDVAVHVPPWSRSTWSKAWRRICNHDGGSRDRASTSVSRDGGLP